MLRAFLSRSAAALLLALLAVGSADVHATKDVAAKAWSLGDFHEWADGSLRSAPEPEDPPALRFPSNVSGSDTSAPYAVIKVANPQDDGLPVWGPADAGVTVIMDLTSYQQTGYYARFWWSMDDGDFAASSTRPYWGFHPYPTTQDNSGTTHVWEVASEAGDFFDSAGSQTPGDGVTVVQDARYLQAMRVTVNGNGTKTLRMYHRLPAVTSADYIERTVGDSYGDSLASIDFAVIIGDSPWFASYQHERASMALHAIKIIAKSMSESDIVTESADMSQLVTSDAQTAIWLGKYGFDSVDDLTCDFGTGRSFTRVDASNLLTVQ